MFYTMCDHISPSIFVSRDQGKVFTPVFLSCLFCPCFGISAESLLTFRGRRCRVVFEVC